jgi:glycosyltransferase involved in cell wall biosynthesis
MNVVGGQSIQANNLIRSLTGAEPHLEVSFLPITSPLPGVLRHLQSFRYIRTLVNVIVYLARLIASIPKSDIIHVFTPGYLAFWIVPTPVLLLGRLLGKKTILHYHDGRAEDHLASSPLAVWISSLATVIVTPSSFLAGIFGHHGLATRSVPNTLDTDCFQFRERPTLRPVFLHNRGLEKVYNVECTLRAFALIQQRYPEASLTVAHDGPLHGKLEALARELGLRNVSFVGAVSPRKMADLYDRSDIYLTSSDHDNMPGSVLEAFACGIPVIATRAGGTEWIAEHNRTGLLVNCGDHRAMAESAFRLLENPDFALQMARAAQRASGHYRIANILPQWLGLYLELCGIHAATPELVGQGHSFC